MKTKRCSRCRKEKLIIKFSKNKCRKDGFSNYCKLCSSIMQKEYIERNRKQYYQMKNRWIVDHLHRTWAMKARAQKRNRGYDVRITNDELEQVAKKTKVCRYCGRQLVYINKDKRRHNSASLDRIDNGKIVSKDTVQIICNQCNATKQDRTHNQFVEYCGGIIEKFLEV